MKEITYTTQGTCSKFIKVVVDDNGLVADVCFIGGCAGNTQGVAQLVKGMKVDDVIKRLSGIKCGMKPTSCPDQLAKALSSMMP